MPTYTETKELLAPLEDVWMFLAEPRHLADWWPGIAAVEPDRRGLASGARWQIRGTNRPSFFRSPNPTGMLHVLAAAPPERLVFQLTGERKFLRFKLLGILGLREHLLLFDERNWAAPFTIPSLLGHLFRRSTERLRRNRALHLTRSAYIMLRQDGLQNIN